MQDEFLFIKSIKPSKAFQPSLKVGIGDDAAIYAGSSEYDEVICVDTMVEGVHFRRDTLTNKQVGYKALAINVSDLAAMGAIPTFYLVSIAIPKSWRDSEVKEIYHGMSECAKEFQMDLIGGDTVSTTDQLVISVTVIGRIESGNRLLRSNAQPGHVVFVTNTLGQSAAGLDLLLKNGREASFDDEERTLIRAHQRPIAQVKAGRIFALVAERLSLNDISDGLASELHEIAEESKVSIILDEDKIPLHPNLKRYSKEKQLEFAYNGGEDFQLVGTTTEDAFRVLQGACEKEGVKLTKIGDVNKGPEKVERRIKDKLLPLAKRGYNHFK